jgi:hypothetical protein
MGNLNMSKINQLNSHIKSSAFNKTSAYSVNVNFKTLFSVDAGMLLYNDAINQLQEAKNFDSNKILTLMTPTFQRSNTKWSQKMQARYVENLLCGCNSEIQLFNISNSGSELGNCLIIDGLQRSTAISDFQLGKFSIFEGIYWADIKSEMSNRLRLKLSIYQFDTEIDAVEFYIQMNEGITHSESDLLVAYSHLENLKSAQLA